MSETWDWAVVGPLDLERRLAVDRVRVALPGLSGLVAAGLPREESLALCRRARVTIELPADAALDVRLRRDVPSAGGLLLEAAPTRSACRWESWEELPQRVLELCRDERLRARLAGETRARLAAEERSGAPFSCERVTVGGLELWIRTEQGGDLDVLREVIEGDAYGLRALQDRPLRTIVDVGGHVGAFAALAARLWPSAEVLSVEPNPRSCELLRSNVAGLSQVRVVEAAVRYDGADVLTASLGASASGFVAPAAGVQELLAPNFRDRLWRCRVVGRVATVTLEELVAGRPIDLLKLDCEGSEHDVLTRASDALLARTGVVVGELHDPEGPARFEGLLRRRLPRHEVRILGQGAICHFACFPRGGSP